MVMLEVMGDPRSVVVHRLLDVRHSSVWTPELLSTARDSLRGRIQPTARTRSWGCAGRSELDWRAPSRSLGAPFVNFTSPSSGRPDLSITGDRGGLGLAQPVGKTVSQVADRSCMRCSAFLAPFSGIRTSLRGSSILLVGLLCISALTCKQQRYQHY